MRSYIIIGSYLLLSAAAHAQRQAATPCPTVSSASSEIVEWLDTEHAERYKGEVGMPSLSSSGLRELGPGASDTPTDRAVCAALNERYRDAIERQIDGHRANELSYYESGGRYFVVLNRAVIEGFFNVGTSLILAHTWEGGTLVYLSGVAL